MTGNQHVARAFERTVGALVRTFAVELWPRDWTTDERLLDEVTHLILDLHRRMPDHLRWGVWLATRLFDAWAWPRHFHPFRQLQPEQRRMQVQRWRTLPLSPFRDLMCFYRNLTSFGCYAIRGQRSRSA